MDLNPTAHVQNDRDDLKTAAPPRRRHGGGRFAHLGQVLDGGEGRNRRRSARAGRGLSCRCWGSVVPRRRARVLPRFPNVDGEALAASLWKKRGQGECAVAVMHGEAVGKERREREVAWPRGRRRPPRLGGTARSGRGSSGSGAAAPPSWRCSEKSGGVRSRVARRGGECGLGGGLNSRSPARRGRGAGDRAVLGWRVGSP